MDFENLPPAVKQSILAMMGSQQIDPQLKAQLSGWMYGGTPLTDPQLIQGINNIYRSNGLNPVDFAGQQSDPAAPPTGAPPSAVPGAPPSATPSTTSGTQVPSATQPNTPLDPENANVPVGIDMPTTPQSSPTKLPATGGGATGFGAGSAIGSTLVNRAQTGTDDSAVQALMVQTLQNLGLDPFSGSKATTSIMRTLLPYMQLVMQYSGLGAPGAAADQGQQYADRFSKMISTPGTFGQIRQFGDELAGKLTPLMGSWKDDEQQGLFNDLVLMRTAGGNTMENRAYENQLLKDRTNYEIANAKNPATDNFLEWLYSDQERRKNPAYAGIGKLLGR